jgi:DNA-directed RNA polymerase specialized sigma24 family protein
MRGRGWRTEPEDQAHDEHRAHAWWSARVGRVAAASAEGDARVAGDRAAVRASWPIVERLIAERLTERQREILELVFFHGLDQPTVALLLGISQQAVSEHLYGKRRGDLRIGGIIPKLRKLCAREGIAVDARD